MFCTCDPLTHCTAVGDVFILKCCFAPLQEELQRWSQAMLTAIQQPTAEPSGPPEARAQTLPAPFTPSPEPSSTKKDKEKKFGRFAKKK